jgi:argininosuccinate lyase
MAKKPWGGRFNQETEKSVEAFTESISFDRRLYKYDIWGSMAHAKMLGKCGIILKKEANQIVKGLKEIGKEIENGKFPFKTELEDIHMNIEKRLAHKIGDAAGKLHTARSRNDQVALDIRLYLRDEILEIIQDLEKLKNTLVNMAEKNIDAIMPGYTHLQRAQPVLFSHYVLAYFEMFERDEERFEDAFQRVNVMPLGSGALSGTTLPIDRKYVAKLLGFPAVTRNSMDSVSDRDFIIEFLSAVSIAMMHLSRLSEDLILWSSSEFDYVVLPDSFCTGSSLMPQKKNPDILELIRGKTGRVYGNLVALLTVMKSLPLTYNRDMQEDKEPLFDSVDTLKPSLKIISELLKKMKINKEKMKEAAEKDFITATDIADYLVKKGLPFRKAHEVVGKMVNHCLKNGLLFKNLKTKELKDFSPLFEADVKKYLSIENSVMKKKVIGGTSKSSVLKRIQEISESQKGLK